METPLTEIIAETFRSRGDRRGGFPAVMNISL
jgi:hypothetical protein